MQNSFSQAPTVLFYIFTSNPYLKVSSNNEVLIKSITRILQPADVKVVCFTEPLRQVIFSSQHFYLRSQKEDGLLKKF